MNIIQDMVLVNYVLLKELQNIKKLIKVNQYLNANKKYQATDKGKAKDHRYAISEKGRKNYQKHSKIAYQKNRLAKVIGANIRNSLQGNKNGKHWESLVNYTLDELKEHLEKQFKPGMCWKNHAIRGWHIDHIKPISSFNIESYDCDDFKKCWKLENLQPLWWYENIKKSNK